MKRAFRISVRIFFQHCLRYTIILSFTFGGIMDTRPNDQHIGFPVERQITFSAKNHELDNNDNFSADGRFLCYDARETFGPGIDRCRSIEKVEIETGIETVLYSPPFSTGPDA